MIWFVLVRNWTASWSCVRAKSWADGSLSELSFSCQAIKDTHACFLYGEMKCLSHPSFSHIILLKEHNNICFYIYTLVVLKSIGLCSYVDILFLRDLSVKLKLYRTQSVNHFAEERLNKVYYCSIALRFKISFSVFFSQLDRTEVIKSNLHPVFAKVFSLDYYFEEVQKLRFEVYDIHGTHSIGTRDDDFLGGVECTLGQVGRCHCQNTKSYGRFC